jgi:hypothetical protein
MPLMDRPASRVYLPLRPGSHIPFVSRSLASAAAIGRFSFFAHPLRDSVRALPRGKPRARGEHGDVGSATLPAVCIRPSSREGAETDCCNVAIRAPTVTSNTTSLRGVSATPRRARVARRRDTRVAVPARVSVLGALVRPLQLGRRSSTESRERGTSSDPPRKSSAARTGEPFTLTLSSTVARSPWSFGPRPGRRSCRSFQCLVLSNSSRSPTLPGRPCSPRSRPWLNLSASSSSGA